MRKYIKILSIITAVVLCFSISGCNGNKSGEKTGIKQIHMWTGDTGSRDAFESVVNDFNTTIGKEKNIEIIYEAKENLGDAMTVALQTNQAPEMFMTGDIAEYSEQGYITAIDDLPDGANLIKQYKEYLTEGKQTYNGKTYSLPFAAAGTYGLIYNKDLFKKAGLVDENGEPTPPKTYKEVREYAKKLTNKSKNEFGIVLPLKWGSWFGVDVLTMSTINSGHYGYDYKTGTYDYSFLKPMMELIMGIKADKSYMPGAEGLDNDPARARFSEGNIGMKFAVSWDVGVFNDQFPAKCDWGVAPLPLADENTHYAQIMAVNTGFKISKNAVQAVGADTIMTVYKWLLSDDVAQKLYELGAYIPFKEGVVEKSQAKELKKGWREFCELVSVSKIYPPVPATDLSGETTISTNFINNVWTGKMSIDEAIENENKIESEGLKKYKSYHEGYDADKFVVSDWDCKIK